MHPIHCAKVDVRTHFRKGQMGRELAIHRCSQGRRRKHTAPPSFSRGTELQDHATLSVPRPSDTVPYSGLRSPSKSRADHEHRVAPITYIGATESPSLWPRPTAPVTPSSVARLPRACQPLNGDGCSLGTVESHCATRRCRTPPGTASPDAVPQRFDWKSLRPERPSGQFLQREWSRMQSRTLRWASRAVAT
jgi:hypothetical protein